MPMNNTEANTTPRPILEPLAVDLDGVRQLLGSNLSDTSIWRLEKQGLLKRVPGIRARLFTVASIRSLVGRETATVRPAGMEIRGGGR